jgi:3-deoxy-D-manno-octulosonic-acid transferase
MKRLALFLYNLLILPILLILLPGYLLRIRKRGGYANKALQRFGIFSPQTIIRIGNGRIWLHAVSVGEVGIALKFAREFHHRNPEIRFLISTTTSTGLSILEKSASEWLEPIANPIDLPVVTSFLVRTFRPKALLMVEADLWPNRIGACKSLGIPVALLNARLSSRSEKRFRMARFITAHFFNQLDLITLTDPGDEARWISLGVNPSLLRLTGNIKHDSRKNPLPSRSSDQSLPLIFLAASTHADEEREIAISWLGLKKDFPNLRLVITPRHAERRAEIREALRDLGINCGLRSEGASLSEDPLLLDTTGELSDWYSRATLVFVGKSLPCSVNRGGQNMIEPLQAGTPVLVGPHTDNFEPLATHLCDAGAAIRVHSSAEIIAIGKPLFADETKRSLRVATAERVLQPHQGATQRTCSLVENLPREALIKLDRARCGKN